MRTNRDTATTSKTSSSLNTQIRRLTQGLLFSSTIGLIAYKRKSLSLSGVLGAILSGTSTFGLAGWPWGLSLIYFFASSSILSHFKEQQKANTAADKFSKGNQRDLGQVLANGGMATLLAIAYPFTHSPNLKRLLEAGYVGCLATATADTWATELGVLSSTPPRLITTGKPTSPGTSGGITPLGTSASAAGAFTSALVFWLLQPRKTSALLPLIGLTSGLAGSLSDSYLGATTQAMYYCPVCQQETERTIHNCGTPTRLVHGIPWLNNDAVNFLATLNGTLLAILLAWLLSRKKDA